jgi:hypothetical protein
VIKSINVLGCVRMHHVGLVALIVALGHLCVYESPNHGNLGDEPGEPRRGGA